MSVSPTYKGLDDRLRVSGLSVTQWAQIAASGIGAIVFAIYLSPLPLGPTISIAVLLAGAPIAASYAFAGAEFSAVRLIGNLWRFARAKRRYLPGPGEVTGYRVAVVETETVARPSRRRRFRRPGAAADAEAEGVLDAWQS